MLAVCCKSVKTVSNRNIRVLSRSQKCKPGKDHAVEIHRQPCFFRYLVCKGLIILSRRALFAKKDTIYIHMLGFKPHRCCNRSSLEYILSGKVGNGFMGVQ